MNKNLVTEIMTKEVKTVFPETPLLDAAKILIDGRFNGVPVVDRKNRVVGVLTEYDLINKGSILHLPTLQKILLSLSVKDKFQEDRIQEDIKKITALAVKDLMNPDPIVFTEDATIAKVIETFNAHHRVNPVPVVNTADHLVGIVSRSDILKLFEYLSVAPNDYSLLHKFMKTGYNWASNYHSIFQSLLVELFGSKDFYTFLDAFVGKICEMSDWVLGEVWVLDQDGKTIKFYSARHKDAPPGIEEFIAFSRTVVFSAGVGLPGRVWATQKTEWLKDVSQEPLSKFPRAEFAKRVGLHSAIGIPIVFEKTTTAVVVFFLKDVREKDEQFFRFTISIMQELNSFFIHKFNEDNFRLLKGAIDFSTDAIILVTTEPKIVYVNPAWQKLNGYTLPEVLGKNPNILHSNKTPLEVYKKMWSTLISGNSFTTEEVINRRKDGTEYKEELTISLIIHEGKTIYYIGIARDITKRKEIEKAKSEFVSATAHQLRSPLTSIGWNVEALLAQKDITEKQKEYLKEIFMEEKTMKELVSMFLNVAKIESGTFSAVLLPVDIKEIADQISAQFTMQVEQKHIHFEKRFDEFPKIKSDPIILGITLQNLLSNAFKYTPNQGRITLELKNLNDSFLIIVSDTGYGIPTGDQDRVFAKFFRSDNIKEVVPEGTGLGLYLVKTMVEKIGGKIWFESPPADLSAKASASAEALAKEGGEKRGTNFFVEIPIIKVDNK